MSPDARRSGAPSEPPKSPSVQQVGIEEGFLSVKCFFKSRSLAVQLSLRLNQVLKLIIKRVLPCRFERTCGSMFVFKNVFQKPRGATTLSPETRRSGVKG
jgi:hypothetical protein